MPARGQVQGRSTAVLETGLQLVSQGHQLVATVSELGDAQASTLVIIDFRDASDRVVARTQRTLTHREPVVLEFTLAPDSGLVRLKATIVVTALNAVLGSPMAVLEEVDLDSFKAELKGACAARLPGGRDSAQTSCGECPGWKATSFSTE